MARRGRAARLTNRAVTPPPPQHSAGDKTSADDFAERPRKPGRVLLIACGALATEILDIKTANGLDHLDLTCLPAKLHLFPDQIAAHVEASVQKHRAIYDEIYVVYADCGTGGQLQKTCDALGVEMIPGPHCYSFFEGNAAFAKIADAGEMSAFYLTDFLVRQFDAFIWRPMGLDKNPELRDMIFGNYTTMVYQSQIQDSDLLAKARHCATRMGLTFEHRHTGYGDLEPILSSWAKIPASKNER